MFRKLGSLVLYILNVISGVLIRLKKYDLFISNYVVTLSGVFFALLLTNPASIESLQQIQDVNAIFLACGGLIGTMLALVVSISVIPIQQASENFTTSIVQVYKDDRVTRYIFATLAIFCLFSFLMVFGEAFGCSKTGLLLTQIILIAASLDLIRWHHRHVVSLLGSNEAINKSKDKIKSYITLVQSRVKFLSEVQRFFFSKSEKKQVSSKRLESVLYSKGNIGYAPLKAWVGELAEVAMKSISNGETYRSELAIFAMAEVANHYLMVRKDNLATFNEANSFGVKGSDVHTILTPIYEHYKDINRIAIAQENETASIHSIKALGKIAVFLNKLNSPNFEKHSAPLTYFPIGYLGSNVDVAQRKGFDDVALQACDILFQIAESAPKDVDIVEVHIPVINELHKIALIFMVSGKGALANRAIEAMLKTVHLVVKQGHFRTDEVIYQVLDKLRLLMPTALNHEKLHGSPIVGLPLSPAYDLTQESSIAYLVVNLCSLIKEDQSGRTNPYGEFISINKKIWRHFYGLGDKNDFGQSFLLWHIIHTIDHISKVFLDLLQHPKTQDQGFLEELEQCFLWYLPFFWLAFNKKSSIKHTTAEEACEILSKIGLQAIKLGHLKITEACAEHIASIANSYLEISKEQYNPFDLVDLLMPINYIRMVLEKNKERVLVEKIGQKMSVYQSHKDAAKINDVFLTRERQLQNDLKGEAHFGENDSARGVLRLLLNS